MPNPHSAPSLRWWATSAALMRWARCGPVSIVVLLLAVGCRLEEQQQKGRVHCSWVPKAAGKAPAGLPLLRPVAVSTPVGAPLLPASPRPFDHTDEGLRGMERAVCVGHQG